MPFCCSDPLLDCCCGWEVYIRGDVQPSRRRQAVDRPRDTSPPSFFDIFQFGISPTQNRQYNFYDCISLSLSLSLLSFSLFGLCARLTVPCSRKTIHHIQWNSPRLFCLSLFLWREWNFLSRFLTWRQFLHLFIFSGCYSSFYTDKSNLNRVVLPIGR